jgi:hypothetical protein
VSYRPEVTAAFEALAEGLAPVVETHMHAAFPDDDWIALASAKLGKRRDVLVSVVDPHFQLEVIARWWGPAFSTTFDEDDREAVTRLRTARNHWAHPDVAHPFDVEYALAVHQDAEQLLRSADSPLAPRVDELASRLRWRSVRRAADERGVDPAQELVEQFAALEREQAELRRQLADARDAARSYAGQGRAVARQLAELQAQYAAVAGLRDEYLALRGQLGAERDEREASFGATAEGRAELAATERAVRDLEAEADELRRELDAARSRVETVDPVATDAGKRWLWLVSALLVVMAAVIVLLAR